MMALASRFPDKRQRSLQMMQAPNRWPTWPFLPVLRLLPDGSKQLGVLYDARHASGRMGYSSTVFLQNLFLLPAVEAKLLSGPRCVYDSLDALLDDGWLVD
jgi:hypothetical protein